MRCENLQQYVLGLEDPTRLPAQARAHLKDCADCRDRYRRLLEIERQVALLPVPASLSREDFLDELRSATPAVLMRLRRWVTHVRPARAAVGLAAAVLVMIGGWWLTHGGGEKFPDRPAVAAVPRHVPYPLLANLMQRDLVLAAARTPEERVRTLADLADDLHGETQVLAPLAPEQDLRALAQLYEEVINDGIVKQAQNLPGTERRRVLDPIAKRLALAGQEAARWAGEVPAASGEPLQAMAAVARAGSAKLTRRE
jgi:hypothetical protein